MIPSAINFEGQAVYAPLDASLGADGQELDVQGFYAVALGVEERLNLGAMLRLEPDNIAGAGPEAVLMSRYQLSFY
jgi:hypothetical protein